MGKRQQEMKDAQIVTKASLRTARTHAVIGAKRQHKEACPAKLARREAGKQAPGNPLSGPHNTEAHYRC